LTNKARKNAWTKIEWDLKNYPTGSGLDMAQVSMPKVYEYNSGVYFIDDFEYE